MRTVIANRGTATFEENLKKAIDVANAQRESLIDLMPSAPTTEDEWLATMTSPETQADLGYLLMLASKNATWINAIIAKIVSTISAAAPNSLAAVQAAAVVGQVRAEMSCTCGQCDTCLVRAKIGDEKTRDDLTKALSPKPERRIFGANGQRLH